MPHIPDRSQHIIGPERLRAAITCNAHDSYTVDGDDLNKLKCLVLRLDVHPGSTIALDSDERIGWANIIRQILENADRQGVR